MKRSIVAVFLVGAIGAVVMARPPRGRPQDVKYYVSQDMVDVDVDGGMIYTRRAVLDGGGHGRILAAGAGCVRRPVGVAVNNCRMQVPGSGMGTGLFDMGDMTRFPATLAVGGQCESVACGVMAGEDPAETDAQKYARLRAIWLDGGRLP